MKKILLLVIGIFLLGTTSMLKAQCYGTVHFDVAANAGATGFPLFGNTTFNITTSYCNEIILISYNGWNGPGSGPVTVNGHPATFVRSATNGNSGSADVYAYEAATAGTYNIVCSTSGYNNGYYCNFAAAFYATGTSNPITIASLTSTINTIACITGGSITDNITTTIAGSMIYCSAEINEGTTTTYPISWTGATFLGNTHTEDGIDAGHAYATATTPGAYTITATNSSNPSNGCGGLTIVLVDIPPPVCGGGGIGAIATITNPTCGNCNGSISIAVTGGSPPYTYTWTPNISTTASASSLCAGTYTISVNDAACHDTTIIATLSSTSINVSANITSNELCNGNCSGGAISSVTGGVTPYVYAWTPSGGTNPSASGLCAGTYTVSVTDHNGCTGTASVDITQPALLSATAAPTNILCFGGTGTITGNATGGTVPYNYVWTPGGNTNAIASGMSAGTYTMTVTDANGCTASASTTITQPAAIGVTVTGPALICIGASGNLTANVTGGTVPYAYAWSSGITSVTSTATITPLISQSYTVTVTDANGCTASGQVTVNLGPPLVLSVSGTSSICSGRSATLCASVTGGTGGDQYLWQPGNQTTPCITVSPATTSTYTLSVSDNCGTTATITTTVRINPSPAVGFNANLSQGCAPLCLQFYNTTTISQGGLAQYVWTFGNGDTADIQSPTYCYPNNGVYDVSLTVTSDSGCSATLNKSNFIKAFSRPAAAFSFSPQAASILAPTIQFTDNSKDAYNILYWNWSFGDATDSTSNKQNPLHTYQDTGTYCANLVVMDVHGCTDTATNCLVIDPVFNLYIPSGFTPNGDGKNEVFQPKGQFIKSFEMYIFDRWGMQLFHTTDITNGWNGTVNGGSTVAQEDTYEYKILVTDSKNKQHTYVGNVNLIK